MLSIRAPDDAPDVVTAIKCLFSNRDYTDFQLISRDGKDKYSVHKLIVSIQSPVLAKSLYGENPIQFLQVQYDKIPLQNLIRFLYNDELFLENILDIKQTKAIADRYEIRALGEICKDELNNIPVSIAEVLSVLELAKEYQNEKKENECLELISVNQEVVFKSRQFLGLPFRRVLDIFDKIRKMKMITDASFLRLGIRWIDTNGTMKNKDLLMEKVEVTSLSLDEYLDIIEEFPAFFSGIEITYASKEIRSRCTIQETPKVQENITVRNEDFQPDTNTKTNMVVEETKISHAGKETKSRCTNQETAKDQENITVKKENYNPETNTKTNMVAETCLEKKDYTKEQLQANLDFFMSELNTANEEFNDLEKKHNLLAIDLEAKKIENAEQASKISELEQKVKKLQEINATSSPMSSMPYTSLDNKQKHLSIEILNTEDGVNVFELEKRARITVQEGNTIRSIQVAVSDVLKKGLIGTVADKKGNYSESDVDLSYEGLYFMLRSLKQLDETLSPIQYCEVLKAALYFQLKGVAEQCIKRISGIVDYDPVFLDGLRTLAYLKDKCLGLKGLNEFKDKYMALLLSEPLRVILHPNFTKCSVDLIIVLLQQKELKVKDESQLLLVIIAWLESEKESRRLLRPTLLKNLAFQNISTADFKYSVMHYPNFFDEKEQKLILAYRNAVGSEIKFYREKLPDWYSTKTRKHI